LNFFTAGTVESFRRADQLVGSPGLFLDRFLFLTVRVRSRKKNEKKVEKRRMPHPQKA
jgi:hypothetical protein